MADLPKAYGLLKDAHAQARRTPVGPELYDEIMDGLRSSISEQMKAIKELLDLGHNAQDRLAKTLKTAITRLRDQFRGLQYHNNLSEQTFVSQEIRAMLTQSQWAMIFYHLELAQGREHLHSLAYLPLLAAVESCLSMLIALL